MPESQQSPSTAISTEIARIYKARYGRGPTSITTHLLGDAVVCLLEDVNTPAQNALLEFGQTQVAEEVHWRIQEGMAGEMQAAVEGVVGRTVRGYIPGFNAELNATTDVFYLEPEAVAGD